MAQISDENMDNMIEEVGNEFDHQYSPNTNIVESTDTTEIIIGEFEMYYDWRRGWKRHQLQKIVNNTNGEIHYEFDDGEFFTKPPWYSDQSLDKPDPSIKYKFWTEEYNY